MADLGSPIITINRSSTSSYECAAVMFQCFYLTLMREVGAPATVMRAVHCMIEAGKKKKMGDGKDARSA